MAWSGSSPTDLTDVKLIAMAAILAAAAAGSLVGICLHHVPPRLAPRCVNSVHKRCCGGVRHRTRAALASYAYLVSGGVLTAAALVHLLPDAAEGLQAAVPGFPLAHFLAGVGFFVTMTIEECAARLSSGSEAAAHPSGGGGAAASGGSLGYAGVTSCTPSAGGPDLAGMPSAASAEGLPRAPTAEDGVFGAAGAVVPGPSSGLAAAPAAEGAPDRAGGQARSGVRAGAPAGEGGAAISLLHGVTLSVGGSAEWAVAVLVLGCLSFHSFVAGAALGVSQQPKEVLDILVAIIAHKGLATSALVTAMLRGGATWRVLVLLALFFACVTPTGVALGMVAQLGLSESPITAGLLAFASGTFLHVGVVEMIVHELQASSGSHGDRRGSAPGNSNFVASLLAAFAGFVGMGVLAAWV